MVSSCTSDISLQNFHECFFPIFNPNWKKNKQKNKLRNKTNMTTDLEMKYSETRLFH